MADLHEYPVPTPDPVGVKVFVGNLSFQVGKEELEKEFAEAGKVLSANTITRGSRSCGYGFVEMATNEGAQKALELNKRLIDGRQINVELAKPREENPEAQEGEAPKKPRGHGRSRGRGRGRRVRGRGARGRGEGEEGEEGAEEAAAEGEGEGKEGDRPRKKGGRKDRSRSGRGGGKSEELRAPSTDTLFVANLPFATNDEELKNFFAKYNPIEAYVVVNHYRFSKGFGFVTFENNQDQQNALELDGSSLLGRPIAVRVALNPSPQPEKAEEAEDVAAPAEEPEAKSEKDQ